jgi:hypothetical protein
MLPTTQSLIHAMIFPMMLDYCKRREVYKSQYILGCIQYYYVLMDERFPIKIAMQSRCDLLL